ncbi:MAG: multiheme c-type cytochrome [Niabella sp.]
MYKDNVTTDPRGKGYAGADVCVKCHKNIIDHYAQTSHFHASSGAFPELKKLVNGSNAVVRFGDRKMMQVHEKDGSIYQSYFVDNKEVQSEKIDIVFGGGVKARTFGYWKDGQVFQLPLTYLTSKGIWTNSPGFPIDHAYFTRPVTGKCFECHTSYISRFEEQSGALRLTEKFRPNTVLYGIDCERCHGPAAAHVDFHQKHPEARQAGFLTAVRSLTRQQQLDLCATCHSGDAVTFRSVFNFKPGDAISAYYMYYPGGSADVHGMQVQLLKQSKCFTQSQLTCITCHHSHNNKADAADRFIATCMSCHQQSKHSLQMNSEHKNCMSCHMPLQPSRSLDFNNSKKANSIAYELHTHRIAIYDSIKN